MSKQTDKHILVIDPSGSSDLAEKLGNAFAIYRVESVEEALNNEAARNHYVLVLLDADELTLDYLGICRALKASPLYEDLPVLLYAKADADINTLAIYDAGVDDVVSSALPETQLVARLNKAVFHVIANRQLKSRLQQANEMAFSAMSDSSDLGVNIQFLVHCHECNNLDELGMLLFRSLGHYQITCSLQIRSAFEVKNQEETGLAKDLEARLLSELKDAGRYVDFGRRCVMNYGQVSLLVKNMPEDEKRYGTIKDNVFSLLQGTDARVKSIDNARMLEMERDVMRGMAHSMQSVMHQVDERYQKVMQDCASLVEDMAMRVESSILFLDLTEAQEETFSNIMQSGVVTINRLFSDGLKIDESFRKLIDYLNNSFTLNEHTSVEDLRRLLDRL